MAKDRLSGKLAVILHADVAGSTALVQQDEQVAHERIHDTFLRFGSLITKYHGRVQELRGDALLAEFERASDAVTAALAFQALQDTYLAQFSDDILPEVRIGIALGEVVIADDTVTGVGVVLAQRVEQLANPGGVCVTAAIHEALPARLPFAQHELGDIELKGFEERTRVYRINLKAGESIPAPEPRSRRAGTTSNVKLYAFAAIALVAITAGFFLWIGLSGTATHSVESLERENPSIAVLPFVNFNNDMEQEHLVDGLTEDLITDISKVSGIFVIARGTAFSYKNRQVSAQQVADELGIRYVLEGSVRRAGQQLRVNTQLTDASIGSSVWAERYDRKLEDIFEIQDQITGQIVKALEVQLTSREIQTVGSQATSNFDAYELFLKGMQLVRSPDRQGLQEGIKAFRNALDLDPDFSRAYGAISIAMVRQYLRGYTNAPVESLNRALVLAQQAVAKGRDVPQVYWALSYVHLYRKEFDKAITAAQKAIEIAPNYADAHALLAFIYNHQENDADAIPSIIRAMQLNPYYTWEYSYNLGYSYYLAGNYRQAIESLTEALDKNATAGIPRIFLIASLVRAGDIDEASWEVDQLQINNPEYTLSHIRRSWAQSNEMKDALIAALQVVGVPD